MLKIIEVNEMEVEEMKVEEVAEEVNEVNKIVEVVEAIEIKAEEIPLPTPLEFFNTVKVLDSKLKISQACNKLLADLEDRYTLATISKKLSGYNSYFKGYKSDNPELNETVNTIKGKLTQHFAASLLNLSEEQFNLLKAKRKELSEKRRGFAENGEPRKVNLPSVSVSETVKKGLKELQGFDYRDIACALLTVTGLRIGELLLPEVVYNWEEINKAPEDKKAELINKNTVKRNFVAVGEYLIAVQGLSKKKGDKSWFVRPTLIPANLVIKAREKYLSDPKVIEHLANFSGDPKKLTDTALYKAVARRFKKIWGEFATVEAFEDDGSKIKDNSSPHKARAFYVWAIVPIIEKKFNDDQRLVYLQKCLAHDDEKDTRRYFNRFDENRFIEGIKLDIPLNINSIGFVEEDKIFELAEAWEEEKKLIDAEIEEEKNTEEDKLAEQENNLAANFDNDKSEPETNNLEPLLRKILEKVSEKLTPEKKAELSKLLAVTANNKYQNTDWIVNIFSTLINGSVYEKAKVEVKSKVSIVETSITEIIAGILKYNSAQPEVENCVAPTFAIVNKIYRKLLNKEIAARTFKDKYFPNLKNNIFESLANRNLLDLSKEESEIYADFTKINNQHRGKLWAVIDRIIEYIDLSFGNG